MDGRSHGGVGMEEGGTEGGGGVVPLVLLGQAEPQLLQLVQGGCEGAVAGYGLLGGAMEGQEVGHEEYLQRDARRRIQ